MELFWSKLWLSDSAHSGDLFIYATYMTPTTVVIPYHITVSSAPQYPYVEAKCYYHILQMENLGTERLSDLPNFTCEVSGRIDT